MSDADPQANRLESLALTLIFTAVSLGLLLAIGVATRSGQASAGWWTKPALAPAVALSLLVFANTVTLWRAIADLRAIPATTDEQREARAKILGWLKPVEFLGYFAAYLWALQQVGYGPATLVFVLCLMWRVGLTSGRWLLAGGGMVLALILIFRVGLGVWMPAPPVYDLFPDAARSALIRWF